MSSPPSDDLLDPDPRNVEGRGADLRLEIEVSLAQAVAGCTLEVDMVRDQRAVRQRIIVPAGIDDGMILRMPGLGGTGERGAGDLFVVVDVLPHERFRRVGNDLVVEHAVAAAVAAAGGSTKLTLLDGRDEEIVVPAGARTGSEVVLRGAGVPEIGSAGAASIPDLPYRAAPEVKRGDVIVRLKVKPSGPVGWMRWLFRLDG